MKLRNCEFGKIYKVHKARKKLAGWEDVEFLLPIQWCGSGSQSKTIHCWAVDINGNLLRSRLISDDVEVSKYPHRINN